MEDLKFIEAVSERDIDLLLLEELTVSSEFQQWFIDQLSDNKLDKVIWVRHSISDRRFGQSDLALIFLAKDNTKYGLLIENKIDAIAMEEQSNRYTKRGEIGINSWYWQRFIVCITAPKLYLDTNVEAKLYETRISYEQIYEWFVSEGWERSLYKSKIIKEAIEQNRRWYTMTPDEKVSDFFNKYFSFVKQNYAELDLVAKLSLKPTNSDRQYFRTRPINKDLKIVHKRAKGCVDLQIAGMWERLDELSDKLSGIICDEIELVQANKSAALRISVPILDRFSLFEEQVENVNKGLIAVKRLLDTANILLQESLV